MQQYLDLLQTIKEKGTIKEEARKGMPGTISLFGYQFRHNLKDGFPLLTTKKLSWNNIVYELLWFLKGDTNIKYLVDNGCNIWNEDQQMFQNRNNWTEEGSTGYQYPWLWRSWGEEDRKWQPKPLLNIKFPLKQPKLNTNSKKVGKIIKSNLYGDVLVLDYLGNNLFEVQFQNTGTIVKVSSSNLAKGEIRDVYYPDVMNIACCGRDKGELDQKTRKKLYVTWTNMLARCYNKDHLSYGNYGGKGKYVNNRWLCFEYFVEDVINIRGWNNKKEDWSNWHLDKDLIGNGYEYSKENCLWLHKNDNLARNERTTYFTFKNIKTGEEYTTNNISEFGRKFKLGAQFIKSLGTYLTNGKLKSYKNWKLIKREDISNKGVDQIKNLIEGLKKNPMSRRHIISAWNPATLDDMALNACHTLVQFNCRPIPWEEKLELAKRNPNVEMENLAITEAAAGNTNFGYVPQYYLDCQLYQRSADSFLGVPYNIASYALMTHIFAKITNMVPGEFVHTFGDVHIYDNHKQQVDVQLTRTPKDLPTLKIVDEGNDWAAISTLDFDLIEMLGPEDFIIEGYNPHPSIKGKLSTGLK